MADTLVNAKEAQRYVSSLRDDTTRRLVALAMTRMLFHMAGGTDVRSGKALDLQPVAPFDLLFCVRVLAEVFEDKEELQAVLDGRPNEWQ